MTNDVKVGRMVVEMTLPIVLEHQLDFAIAHCAELRETDWMHWLKKPNFALTIKNKRFPITAPLPHIPKQQKLFVSDLNKLHDAIRYRCFAQFLQVLHNIRRLQPYTDSCIQGIGRQFVLMDVVRSAHWLCNGHQEVLSILIHWWEGFKKNVSIWSLEKERRMK